MERKDENRSEEWEGGRGKGEDESRQEEEDDDHDDEAGQFSFQVGKPVLGGVVLVWGLGRWV